MNNTPLLPIFASSQDPTKVSTTVSGFIVAYSSLIITLAAALFHVTLTANNVVDFGTDLGYVAAAIVVILGVSHKLIQKYGKNTAPQTLIQAQMPS